MSISRYKNTSEFINDDDGYRQTFSSRFSGTAIKQFGTLKISYPTDDELSELSFATIVWSPKDRYYKLAYQYYGNSEYWWVIAYFNHKIIEADNEQGDVLKVPLPLNKILSLYGIE